MRRTREVDEDSTSLADSYSDMNSYTSSLTDKGIGGGRGRNSNNHPRPPPSSASSTQSESPLEMGDEVLVSTSSLAEAYGIVKFIGW